MACYAEEPGVKHFKILGCKAHNSENLFSPLQNLDFFKP